MKILITGATGFIGTTLIPWLYGQGINDMVLLVRNPVKPRQLFAHTDCKIISTGEKDWREQVIACSPDITLHMATCFTGKCDVESVKEIINTNILFSTLLLEALSHTTCRHFINIGTYTEFVYGSGEYRPNNLYSATKTSIRSIIRYYQTISKWNWINVVVYSPYGRKNKNKKVIDHMVDALTSIQPVAFTRGEQVLDFVHVDDIADFFFTLISRLAQFSEPYYEFHLGTGQGHSIREVAQIIEKVWGKRINAEWGRRVYSNSDVMYAVAPIGKNLALLNWKTRINLERGIKILYDDLQG